MSNRQYNLSIIIPAYNAARFIERAIMEASTIVPTPEIIVVDDGSSDNTYNVCMNLQKKFSTLYVYTQKMQVLAQHGIWVFKKLTENGFIFVILMIGLMHQIYPY